MVIQPKKNTLIRRNNVLGISRLTNEMNEYRKQLEDMKNRNTKVNCIKESCTFPPHSFIFSLDPRTT